jgi:hypothetical protein
MIDAHPLCCRSRSRGTLLGVGILGRLGIGRLDLAVQFDRNLALCAKSAVA